MITSVPRLQLDADAEERTGGLPWAHMPVWFHFVSAGYFATNLFMIAACWAVTPHPLPAAMATFGLIGGLFEHVTPYFPRVYIPLFWEKVLFRAPSVIGVAWILAAANPPLWMFGLVAGFAWLFSAEGQFDNVELRFHLQHLFAIHAPAAMFLAWLMVRQLGADGALAWFGA